MLGIAAAVGIAVYYNYRTQAGKQAGKIQKKTLRQGGFL